MVILGFILLLLLGPRFFNVVYWLVRPNLYGAAFGNNLILPILGIAVLPWTTLMYVIAFPGGLSTWDWIFIAIGFFADISSYAGSGYGGKKQMSSSKPPAKPASTPAE